MEDHAIIRLYLQRDEAAIRESESKYGAYCRRIAQNVLSLREDAEECVNDTWHTAWRRIPPLIPHSLKAFLGRVTRDLAISRYRKSRAKKRYAGMELLLSELSECLPGGGDPADEAQAHALRDVLDGWLAALPAEERVLFVRRYWYGEPLAALAKERGCRPGALAQRMLRLRESLRAALEQEGVEA